MKLLLDQGLPRSTVEHLQKVGVEAAHVGGLGLASASDARILDFARRENRIVVTLDSDFHALLAFSGAKEPSVIRIRIEGLRAGELAQLLADVPAVCADEVRNGAMVSVTEDGIRIRKLPVLR